MKFKLFIVGLVGVVALAGCDKTSAPADKAKTKAQAESAKKAAAGKLVRQERERKSAERKKRAAQAGALFGHWKSCYTKFESFGSIEGKLTAVVDAAGNVATVSYRGTAPKPVQNCLLTGARKAKLPEPLKEPASAFMSWSGTLAAGGSAMLSVDSNVELKSAMKPEVQKQLDDALGKKAPATP